MKSILVQADTSQACENRLKLALGLAQSFGAHLTALHVTPNYTVPVYAEAPIGPEIIDGDLDMGSLGGNFDGGLAN